MIRRLLLAGLPLVALASAMGIVSAPADTAAHSKIEYMPTRSQVLQHRLRAAAVSASPAGGRLVYRGGGVEVIPKAYLVVYGSQWKNGDPDNELPTITAFLRGLQGGGDSWSTIMTQYCQGAPSGAHSCGAKAKRIAHAKSAPLAKVFFDVSAPAPAIPTDTDLEAAAVKAAAHFGNTTAASNRNTQYIIATPKGFNTDGFGVDYCAWHSSVSSKYGELAYVNLPYIAQAGWDCGAGIVNSPGTGDGISVVGGHEFTEAATDPFPNSGWVDRNTDELADKCVWIDAGKPGAATNVTLSTGTFPVQSLWSNSFGTSGGCVTSYVSRLNQR